ncbi:MAG: GatB/YqeY domain-containing protein [Myxococcales bacterium]|nr:GatB/YqeY domain-containing protein [Myxococcales bacterium]
MSLTQQLETDMKAALRGRETLRLETIRGIRGAVRNKEIELGEPLGDEGIVRVIRTLAKQRGEAIEQYQAAGRSDLAQKERDELAVLESYLPAAPDAAQIERVVREVIAEVGAAGPKDIGRVMKPSLERLGPAADGKQVNQIVRRLLG